MSDLARLTLRGPQRSLPRYTILLAAWILTMVSTPIVKAVAGDDGLIFTVALSVLLQAATVCTILAPAWGWRRTLQTLLIVAVLGWGFEFIGSSTGFPFGGYAYTERMQPQLGHVPLLIPLAWFMMLPSAWVIARLLVGQPAGFRGWLTYTAVAAAAFTAWDLFLDPQMVAWDLWRWDNPVGYFGIPWSNYAGWLLVSSVMTLAIRPASLPVGSLLLIYGVTWFLESVGLGIFWGLWGPAAVGCIVMGGFLVAGLWRWQQERRTRAATA